MTFLTFPEFLTGSATSMQPQQGMIDMDSAQSTSPSISVELTTSTHFVRVVGMLASSVMMDG